MKKVLVAVAATASLPMLLSPIEAEASTGAMEQGEQLAITAEAEPTETANDLEATAVGTKVEDDPAIMAESELDEPTESAEPDSQFVVVNTTTENDFTDQFVVTDEIGLNSQANIAITPETFDTEEEMGKDTGAPGLGDSFTTTQLAISKTGLETGLQIKSDTESAVSSDQSFAENEDEPDETTDSSGQFGTSEDNPAGPGTETTDAAGLDENLVAVNELSPENQPATVADSIYPTYQEAYDAMIALKEKYPEGMEWTNYTPYGSSGTLGDGYAWKGGPINGVNMVGAGCAAFAMILSDAAFDTLPSRTIMSGSFTYDDVKVGDILRINGNSHSVIVLQKTDAGVIIAEGNYNKSVHWGRVLTKEEVMAANFIVTRYPANFVPSDDAEANKVEHDGTVGNLKWELTNSGTLTISGSGAISNFSADSLPKWNDYNSSINTIIIGQGVTSVGDYAFYQSNALSIYIADSVTSIGDYAFAKSQLLSVTIPGKVTTIGKDAFFECQNLVSATVSEGVKSIGDEAFRGCTSLTHIDFPSTITSVGAGAFMDCKKMTRVRFAPGSAVVTMGDNLFSRCWALTDVTLPEKAERISNGMFAGCISLPELYIPAGVTAIYEAGSLSGSPFMNCDRLTVINFGGSEETWNSIGGKLVIDNFGLAGKTTVNFNVAFVNPFDDDTTTNPDGGDSEDKDSGVSNGSNNSAGTTKPKPGNGNQSTNGSQGDSSQGTNGSQGNNGSQGDGSQNDPAGGNDANAPGASGGQSPSAQAPVISVNTTTPQNAGSNLITTTAVSDGTEAVWVLDRSDSQADGSGTTAKKQEKVAAAESVNDQDTAGDDSAILSDVINVEEIAERLSELEEENGHLKDTVRNLIVAASVLGAGALGELFYFLRKIRKIKNLLQ